jgi:hypothetical protein
VTGSAECVDGVVALVDGVERDVLRVAGMEVSVSSSEGWDGLWGFDNVQILAWRERGVGANGSLISCILSSSVCECSTSSSSVSERSTSSSSVSGTSGDLAEMLFLPVRGRVGRVDGSSSSSICTSTSSSSSECGVMKICASAVFFDLGERRTSSSCIFSSFSSKSLVTYSSLLILDCLERLVNLLLLDISFCGAIIVTAWKQYDFGVLSFTIRLCRASLLGCLLAGCVCVLATYRAQWSAEKYVRNFRARSWPSCCSSSAC